MTLYRTYDAHWNRTGYSSAPRYPGQAGAAEDYPAKCHCGAEMGSWRTGRSPQAECANGHPMMPEPVHG